MVSILKVNYFLRIVVCCCSAYSICLSLLVYSIISYFSICNSFILVNLVEVFNLSISFFDSYSSFFRFLMRVRTVADS